MSTHEDLDMKRLSTTAGLVLCLALNVAHAQRRGDLDEDRKLAESNGWIYNDFDKALEEAKRLDKPILVVIRCSP